MNSKLNAAIFLFHPERNQRLSIAAEVALQLANLFLGIGFDLRRYGAFSLA